MRFHMSQAILVYACLLGCTLGAMPASAADGALDPSLDPPLGTSPYFGVPGLFTFRINLGGAAPFINNDYVAATAVQVDGKILAAGFSWNTYLGVDQNACVLTRFNADGTLDSGFGGVAHGRIVVNFNPASGENDCYLSAIALQGDGRIVVAGNLTDASHGERGVVFRYNADGSPDNAFNNGGSGNHVIAGNNSAFSSVVIDTDGTILTAGHSIQGGQSDENFFLEAWAGNNGNAKYWDWQAFNLGADHDDRAFAMVLQHGVCTGQCVLPIDVLYLVGSANNTVYADGLTNHDCAIAAYAHNPFIPGSKFESYTLFNGSGHATIDFPVGGTGEGDNICRAAVGRPGYGVIVGGENYYIAPGNPPGLASLYALAEVALNGSVTRQDSFAFFQLLPTPGIFNGIYGMAHEPNGKLLVTGYAGTSDANHQPADAGVIRFNDDFSRDTSFGDTGAGSVTLSLDGLGGLFLHQREWATALALDNRGHVVVAGERSLLYPGNDYDWLVGRLTTSDEIFRDSYDGVVPPVE